MDHARAGHGQTGAGPSGEVADRGRGVARRLLVPHAEELDALALGGGGDPEDREADDAEHVLHTLLLEAAGDQGIAVDGGHGGSLLRAFRAGGGWRGESGQDLETGLRGGNPRLEWARGADKGRGCRVAPAGSEDVMPALDGMRILDLSQYEAGPSCTQALAWMGADVVKVEAPGFGDPGRVLAGTSAYFWNWNLNKRSIVLNLRNPEGRRLLLDLVPRFDVVIENYAPGVLSG